MSRKHDHDHKAAATAGGEPPPAAPPPPPAEKPAEQAAENETAAMRERLLRLQADFDNYRKRIQREKAEWITQANEQLLRELLPVLDHFEIGLRTAAEHAADKSVCDGFRMVEEQLKSVLRKAGLLPLDAVAGPFDPHAHEALAHAPSNEHPADHVLQQTRRGYRLGDKLLRPAQVIVSSGPGPDTPETGDHPPPAEDTGAEPART